MKKPRRHVVPLTERMRAILDRQAERRCGTFIFPGRHPHQPVNPATPRSVLAQMGVTGITLHGFRSTWRDWAGDHGGVLREVAEMQLAHDAETRPKWLTAASGHWRSDARRWKPTATGIPAPRTTRPSSHSCARLAERVGKHKQSFGASKQAGGASACHFCSSGKPRGLMHENFSTHLGRGKSARPRQSTG